MAAPTFVGVTSTNTRVQGARTLPLPTGTAVGDMMLLIGTNGSGKTLTTPSGFTQAAITTAGITSALCYKIVTSADITAGSVTGTSSNGNDILAFSLAVYRGTTATPDAVGTYYSYPTASVTMLASSVTTTVADTRVVNLFGRNTTSSGATVTVDSPLIDRTGAMIGTGVGDETYSAAGATTARSATQTASAVWASFTVALAPDAGAGSVTGAISASLPALSANLSGTSALPVVSGTVSASLPALSANFSGETYPPGTAGDLSAVLPGLSANLSGVYATAAALSGVLPSLSANLVGTSALPPVTGGISATLPALQSNIAGQSFSAGTDGYLEGVLPGLAASIAGRTDARNGFGLVLASTATVSAETPLAPDAATVALHIIATTVPVPTLVAGRPS